MDIEILKSLESLGGIGVLGLFIIALIPLFKALGRKLEAKINNNIPYDVSKGIQTIQNNHLHEIKDGLARIERKLDKLDTIENLLIKIDTKTNK